MDLSSRRGRMTMTDSEGSSDTKGLEPREVAAQTAALARHLHSSGVAFLPNPEQGGVNKWCSQMRLTETNTADSSAEQQTTPAPEPTSSQATSHGPSPAATPSLLDDVGESYQGEALTAEERTAQLQSLQQQVSSCTRCPQLAQCRTQTVFGEGSVTPRVAFFGEGPGADEDRTGRPFVGKAGQLLTKMIEACKMKREDVYILNTVKCRPPGNRNPEPEEVSNCREYFERQLQILRPEYIVCLGAVASQALLKSKLSVGRMRGTLHRYFDSKVLVTYHPAYLLRNASAKKFAWQDLQLMLRDAGLMK